MVRTGAVDYPRDWEWCEYHELIGARKRYRLLSVGALLEALGRPGQNKIGGTYQKGIEEVIAAESKGQRPVCREPEWTNALAVGSREFVGKVKKKDWRDVVSFTRDPLPSRLLD